ncbi:MAG: hypothetical protein LW650_05420 [Planctomycetaceae bacterium]|jgi:1,4-dihydroxy-6-naphthoate synthase|nr:ABC transporter substrate-binding protein [Phycisphaerales bacterium]MCE2652946.1 hypothetical protein [Planctomycetaceae bacterium]
MSDAITLTLAHSADADDVFMWWPVTGMLDPANPQRLLAPPAIDTGRFSFRGIPEDIAVLNRRAREVGDLDITAISFAHWPAVAERYAPTSFGSSFGDDWGPKLVRRAGWRDDLFASRPTGETLASAIAQARPVVAIPGRETTAYLAFRGLFRAAEAPVVVTSFDRIMETVASGVDGVNMGLLIHEAQFTFAGMGLAEVADMGVTWKAATGLPLPLGANVVRRDLDARFGPGGLQQVVDLLDASVQHALKHRSRSLDYARLFSPLKDDLSLSRYIDTYVSRWTVDCGEAGERAIRLLLQRGAEAGLIAPLGEAKMLRPSPGPGGNGQ